MKAKPWLWMCVGLLQILAVHAQAPSADARALWLLEHVRIAELRFQNAEVREVLHFLLQASREGDPEGLGLNLAYIEPETPPGRIHLDLRQVDLTTALRMVTAQAGLVYRLERGVVRVEERTSQRTQTRFYPVDPAQMERYRRR